MIAFFAISLLFTPPIMWALLYGHTPEENRALFRHNMVRSPWVILWAIYAVGIISLTITATIIGSPNG